MVRTARLSSAGRACCTRNAVRCCHLRLTFIVRARYLTRQARLRGGDGRAARSRPMRRGGAGAALGRADGHGGGGRARPCRFAAGAGGREGRFPHRGPRQRPGAHRARLADGDSPLRHVPAEALRRALGSEVFRTGGEADLAGRGRRTDLRAHATGACPAAGPLLRGGGGDAGGPAPAARPARRAGVHDVARHHAGAGAASAGGHGPRLRARLLPGLLAGTRTPRQPRLFHRRHPEGGGGRRRGLAPRGADATAPWSAAPCRWPTWKPPRRSS